MKTTIRKTMLYKTGVEYGDYTMNHVQGCSHGCLYPCYAFLLKKRFGQIKSYEQWIEPVLVSNTLELLDKEIPRLKDKIHSVHLCFTTDPFMEQYPEVGEMSLKIINRLNKDNIKTVILTKSVLPDSLLNTSKINEYGITLVSLDESYRKKYEPYTPNYNERIAALRRLHDAGYYTWVSIEPYPTPNICEQDLQTILERINFVDYIVFGRLHYNKLVSEYPNYKQFYNDLAIFVEKYCKVHRIKCHIKNGTKI